MSCHLNLLRLHFHSFLWLHFWSFSRFVASCAFILAFCGSICFHVGFLWLYFYPLIFAFCGFISFQFCLLTFHFGLLGFHFLSVLPSHPSFPFICPFSPFISFHFWPSRPSFPFILVFWAFISFHFCLLTLHFGLLGFHFLSFLPSHLSFPFILAFWVFFSFHFDPLGLHVSMQNHRVCIAFNETVLSKCAKNIGFSASFSEIDLQKLQKHACFCTFWASIFAKKRKNSMFFAIFENHPCQKMLKTRGFFQFLTRFSGKQVKNIVFSAFFYEMDLQKLHLHILGKHLFKKAQKLDVFCDFCKASLQKEVENSMFFALDQILSKKGQKHEVFRIFWPKYAGKNLLGLRAQPPPKKPDCDFRFGDFCPYGGFPTTPLRVGP